MSVIRNRLVKFKKKYISFTASELLTLQIMFQKSVHLISFEKACLFSLWNRSPFVMSDFGSFLVNKFSCLFTESMPGLLGIIWMQFCFTFATTVAKQLEKKGVRKQTILAKQVTDVCLINFSTSTSEYLLVIPITHPLFPEGYKRKQTIN